MTHSRPIKTRVGLVGEGFIGTSAERPRPDVRRRSSLGKHRASMARSPTRSDMPQHRGGRPSRPHECRDVSFRPLAPEFSEHRTVTAQTHDLTNGR